MQLGKYQIRPATTLVQVSACTIEKLNLAQASACAYYNRLHQFGQDTSGCQAQADACASLCQLAPACASLCQQGIKNKSNALQTHPAYCIPGLGKVVLQNSAI